MKNELLLEKNENILNIKLNRPEVLNAIIPEMIDGIMEGILQAKKDSDIKAVLISGEGRSFCSGGDIKRMSTRTAVSRFNYIGEINSLIRSMNQLEKPIVAAVHGYTAGLGISLALAADQIIASEDTSFLLSFSKVGLISDGGALYFLAQNLGSYRTKELLFKAQPLSAQTAQEWGIINRIYSKEEFKTESINYTKMLADGPTMSYGLIKKLTNLALYSNLEEILEMERSSTAVIGTSEDHKEGINAFIEKRKPYFQGK